MFNPDRKSNLKIVNLGSVFFKRYDIFKFAATKILAVEVWLPTLI